jgi:hypothetical protein
MRFEILQKKKLTAYAIAYPSNVLVPLPSSSSKTSESTVAFWRTEAVSVHSTRNVPANNVIKTKSRSLSSHTQAYWMLYIYSIRSWNIKRLIDLLNKFMTQNSSNKYNEGFLLIIQGFTNIVLLFCHTDMYLSILTHWTQNSKIRWAMY